MVVQAYILIQTDVGKAAEVAKAIAQVNGVTLAEDVTGPYDVIVRAEAKNVDELADQAELPHVGERGIRWERHGAIPPDAMVGVAR